MTPNLETRRLQNHASSDDRLAPVVVLRYEKPVTRLQKESASNDPTGGETVNMRTELEAWACQAFAANGFGDADISPQDVYAPHVPPSTDNARLQRLLAEANMERAQAIGEMIAAAIMTVVAFGTRAIAGYKRWRWAAQTRNSLQELDDRQLRDIGFARDEISSVVAELVGAAERTRLRARI